MASEPARDPFPHRWIIAMSVTIVSMMELIDSSVINVAVPQMCANLGATIDEIIWVSIGYILASVIMIPMAGWLSTAFGRRNYFLGSIIVFTAASMLCGASGSLNALVFWRVIQGIGGGAFLSTTQAILHDSFPPAQKKTAMAVYGVGMMCGPAIGPTLGGFITQNYSWPWIFYINLPFGVLAYFLLSAYLKDREAKRGVAHIDAIGMMLMVIGIGCVQFVLHRGEHYDWFESDLITAMTIIAVISLAGMTWWELRQQDPFLNLRVLRDASLRNGSVFTVVLGITVFGSIFMAPLFIQTVLGYDPQSTGWITFPGAVASAVGMVLGAKLMEKIDPRLLLVSGAFAMIYAMYLHSRFTLNESRASLFWPIALRGFGAGIMFLPLNTRALINLKGRDLIEGSAIFNLLRQLGGSLGIAILATMYTRGSTRHMAEISEKATLVDQETGLRLARLTAKMASLGFDPATSHLKSLGFLNQALHRQAALLSFQNLFAWVGWMMLFSLPIAFLLPQNAAARPNPQP